MRNRGQFLKDLYRELVADYINIRENKLAEFLYIYKKDGQSWYQLIKYRKKNLQPVQQIIEKNVFRGNKKRNKDIQNIIVNTVINLYV